jgi:hypothetical protein
MAVKNGRLGQLEVTGAISARVGVQDATPGDAAQYGASIVVAWMPPRTMRRLIAGDRVKLEGAVMRVCHYGPSVVTKNMMVAYLAPVQ